MSADQNKATPDNIAYVFKDYLPDGSIEYQVRRVGEILSRHSSLKEAMALRHTMVNRRCDE